MKKLLLFCLAAMLVLAFTLPAAAKTTLTASGDMMVGGFYLSNPMANRDTAVAITDARMYMDGHLKFKLQTNPKLWFELGLGFMDKDWGVGTTGYSRYDDSGFNQTGAGWLDMFNTVEVEQASILLVVYKGWFMFGRGKDAPSAAYGPLLKSNVGANLNVDSGDSLYDRIMVNQTIGPWNLFFLYQKIGEADFGIALVDNDWDLYGTDITYTWKTGKATGSLYYGRDYWTWPHGRADDNGYTLTGTGYQGFGDFHFGARFKYGWGTASGGFPGAVDVKTSGWNAMATAEYIKGPYKIGVQGIIFNGQDPLVSSAVEDQTVGNIGQDYSGLYAAFGHRDGLLYPGNEFLNDTTITGITVNDFGLQVFLGFAEYKMMNNLWLRAALGFLRWDSTPAGTPVNIGTEVDLGANYKIMKGLNLGVHFGYFIPGDWFVDPNKGNHIHLDWELTMKF